MADSKKARSGAKLHTKYNPSKNDFFMSAWKATRQKMYSFKIFQKDERHKEGISKSDTGKEWVPVVIVCSAPLTETVVVSGLMNLANHKVYIKDWNWMINPKASNGGYIGKHISSNYSN